MSEFARSERLLTLSAVILTGMLISCGGGPAISNNGNGSQSGTSQTGTGQTAPQLSVKPASMNFGSLAVGGTNQQTGSLGASGSSVTVSSASWNGSGYSLSGITFPTTIAAGGSVAFKITFTPQASGNAPGQVSFVSNATNSPTSLALSGSGIAAPVQHSVDLFWNASTSQVAGYNIYRGVQSGGPYSRLNSSLVTGLSFTDSSVQSGRTYYYAATAVDSSNVESGYSNLATATIP